MEKREKTEIIAPENKLFSEVSSYKEEEMKKMTENVCSIQEILLGNKKLISAFKIQRFLDRISKIPKEKKSEFLKINPSDILDSLKRYIYPVKNSPEKQITVCDHFLDICDYIIKLKKDDEYHKELFENIKEKIKKKRFFCWK